ncbi:MAG: transposase [Oligoflexia bacterium]|nr:transposase [Oligoflexia bacterium]
MKEDEAMIIKNIEEIVRELPVYGYRRVTAVLRHRYGLEVNWKRVYRIMRERKLCMPASHSHKKMFRGVPFATKLKVQDQMSYGV